MASPRIVTAIKAYFHAVTTVLTRVPSGVGLVVSRQGGAPTFVEAYPFVTGAVGATDAEITALQSTQTRVFDARSGLLWTVSGGTWTATPYNGGQAFLRPGSVIYSSPNDRYYYVDMFLRFTLINRSKAASQA